jgi:hypothetical protein
LGGSFAFRQNLDKQVNSNVKKEFLQKIPPKKYFFIFFCKFGRLLSSGQEFDEKYLDLKHVLKVYLMPSREKKYFVLLPLPILPVRLKILYLSNRHKNQFILQPNYFN